MKKIILLVIALLVCAAIIYCLQNNDQNDDSHAPSQTSDQTITSDTIADSSAPVDAPAMPTLSSAADNARVFFISPNNGDVVSSPVKIEFGIENMQVSPAGIDVPFSGHHHILIDMQELPDMSQPLPASETLVHFGGGQTETELVLSPGEHTLQLVLGNYLHIPHEQPVISEKITITVE